MAVGIFGKLPAKRDFVQNGMPPELMEVLDPWLQAAVAQSRNDMGKEWLEAYLAAPIWRFWLGRRIAGRTVRGALMPSVDGVGRYFPLCLAGAFDDPVAPPDLDPHDEWFEELEGHMLETLTDEGNYEALVAGAASVNPPEAPLALVPEGNLRALFAHLRHENADMLYGDLSYWWVPPGPGGLAPRAMLRRGLPSPVEYASMITIDGMNQPMPQAGGA